LTPEPINPLPTPLPPHQPKPCPSPLKPTVLGAIQNLFMAKECAPTANPTPKAFRKILSHQLPACPYLSADF
jgi:hypothetical protein